MTYPNIEELHKFLNAYIAAALWSSTDDGKPLDEDHDRDSIAGETLHQMHRDCRYFMIMNEDDIVSSDLQHGRDLSDCGHDYWLTRAGHGTGFWDRGMSDIGTRLATFSCGMGEMSLYIGDDSKIHH